jgi:hypothetical protein
MVLAALKDEETLGKLAHQFDLHCNQIGKRRVFPRGIGSWGLGLTIVSWFRPQCHGLRVSVRSSPLASQRA